MTPALRRLGLATPPPFVGRADELSTVREALLREPVIVVHGAVGAGKTRLAKEIAAREEIVGALDVTYVRCRPGDRDLAVRARCERNLKILPGSLSSVLASQARLLIIDDVHHIVERDAAQFLSSLTESCEQGRLIFLTRDVLPLRNDRARFEMTLEGLDPSAAHELWSHHEDVYGPTSATACDEALIRTRGMPLALRREYARAAFGQGVWELDTLADDVRRALEAVAVISIPAAPAAVAAVATGIEPEPALIQLVSLQLIDPLEDGRFAIHDVVRDQVLDEIADDRRIELERRAAELVATVGRGKGSRRRVAWHAGDDGALGLVDPIDRLRDEVTHLVEAGDFDAAIDVIANARTIAQLRGASGELLALIDLLVQRSHRDERLVLLHADIAQQLGRVIEALEVGGHTLSPIDQALLAFRSGDVDNSIAQLEAIHADVHIGERCMAAAALAEIHLLMGNPARAEDLAAEAFQSGRADISEAIRAQLHVALGAVELYKGNVTAARASLARAASAGRLNPALTAMIRGRRAACLARERRMSNAESALADAERVALEVDAITVAEQIRGAGAWVAARRGDYRSACATLRGLVVAQRERGDEIHALRNEAKLARLLANSGELAAAGELASGCLESATHRGLRHIIAQAELVNAIIDAAELRTAEAAEKLTVIVNDEGVASELRAEAKLLLAQVRAWVEPQATPAAVDGRDTIDDSFARAMVALAAGDTGTALSGFSNVAVRGDRAGRSAVVARSLALAARLQFARGDKASAAASARRALRDASNCGLADVRSSSLLILAAMDRDAGDSASATHQATMAHELAVNSGLPIHRLVAAEALNAIRGGSDTDNQHAAAATMSQAAVDETARILADLGLTTVRPYRVVLAGGQESFVAEANAGALQLHERNLAIDGVRELIFREGEQTADLRRRSLLKRLLFLFAGSPGTIFSKEEIVETVWDVEYHPLRHDAALFTNIMRIRRLLGKDGADLIRVGEEGYRFTPPKDFLFVQSINPL